MNADDRARELRQEAMDLEYSDPEKAMKILKQVVKDYTNTLTVGNLVVDDIIRIAVAIGNYDDAIEACTLGVKAKDGHPNYQEDYRMEAQALKFEKEQRYVEATEIRFQKSIKYLETWGSYWTYGDKFADLGELDRAWKLYNDAVRMAVKEGQSPHNVRVSMANLLLKENKTEQAGKMIITGIDEANRFSKTGVPKKMITQLNKILKSLGVKDRSKSAEISELCKAQGSDKAIEIFEKVITEKSGM
jgi:tetratricopeptide (TPR) repeat protein